MISCILFTKMEGNSILKEVMKHEVKTLKRVLIIFSVSYSSSLFISLWYSITHLRTERIGQNDWKSLICEE